MLTFYNAYVKSTLEYGLLINGNLFKTHLDKIYKMQKRICRAIFFKRKTDAIRNIMTKYHLLTLNELFANNIFKFMFDEFRKPESVYLKLDSLSNHRETRSLAKTFTCTQLKKNIKNSLRIKVNVAYNFAQENNLIPESMRELTPGQLRTFLRSFTYLYIQDSYEVFNLFFDFLLFQLVFVNITPRVLAR